MADLLRKIERPGSTRPLQYAVRDVRGVEAPSADPTERSGFNEEAEWTARADAAINCQHDADGNHFGLGVPTAIVILSASTDRYGVVTLGIDDMSWREGSYQRDTPFVSLSGDVFTFTKPWSPEVMVQLEGAGRIAPKVQSATEIEIARTNIVGTDGNGGHIVFAFYEAV